MRHPHAAVGRVVVRVDARLRVRRAAHGPGARLDVAVGVREAKVDGEREHGSARDGVDADRGGDEVLVVVEGVRRHAQELPDQVQLRAPEVQDPGPEGPDEDPEEAAADGALAEEGGADDEREEELDGHGGADHGRGVVLHELCEKRGGGSV